MANVFTIGDSNFNFQLMPLRFWRIERFFDPDWPGHLGPQPPFYQFGPLEVTYWRTSWRPIQPTHPQPVGIDARLHDAVIQGEVSAVNHLIREGADVSSKNEHGVPVLMLAIGPGNAELIRVLLAGGADPNSHVSESHITALMWAATTSVDMVRLLLEAGADPNAQERHSTATSPIHWAFHGRKTKQPVVQLLIRFGVDVNQPNHYGETPLLLAAKHRLTGLIHPLLSAGAEPNAPASDGTTAWTWASKWGNGAVRRVMQDWYDKAP